MSKRYTTKELTRQEREEIERIVAEQLEMQHWFAVVIIEQWVAEVIIPIN